MNIYLAGVYNFYNYLFNDEEIVALTKKVKPNFLESYYYIRGKDITKLLNLCSNFLLDSGAFTLRQNSKDSVNWVEYIKEYASFINKYDIKYFFELDIDNLVGYEKVKEYRKLLENLTGKKCIPVWHPSRGFEEFTEMCKEYDYVSIGGIAGAKKDIEQKYKMIFPNLITEAHKYNCMIHGLGCTSLTKIQEWKFDSVDSTSWLAGQRFGILYRFEGDKMTKKSPPKGKKLAIDFRQSVKLTYTEWLKYIKYAREFL